MKANLLTLAVAVLMVALLLMHASEVVWSTPKVIGAVICGISFPLFVLARWQLGSSFSVKAKANQLVTTGLYSRIRNPIYLFGGLFAVGVSLFVSVWGPLVVALILMPLQIARARREERVLADAFGEEYERYKSKTWF
jgi:protein-S-isoprenylcysteine O-methyltransferase Ste14